MHSFWQLVHRTRCEHVVYVFGCVFGCQQSLELLLHKTDETIRRTLENNCYHLAVLAEDFAIEVCLDVVGMLLSFKTFDQ